MPSNFFLFGTILLCFSAVCSPVQGQTQDIRLSLSCIVIPHAKENEDLVKLYQGSSEIMFAVEKLNEWVSNSNLQAIDFKSYINSVASEISNSKDGIHIKLSDAIRKNFTQDIIIEVRPDIITTGTAKKAVITINAYENVSGQVLFHLNFESSQFVTNDNAALIVKAFGSDSSANYEKFQESMLNAIDKIKGAGMPLQLRISFAPESHYNPVTIINSLSKPLSAVIENWIKNNSRSYQLGALIEKAMFFQIIRLPYTSKEGNRNSAFDFSSAFGDYLRSLGISNIDASPEGGRIYVIIK